MKEGLEETCTIRFYEKVENILPSSVRDNYILQHITMAGQVLVGPTYIDLQRSPPTSTIMWQLHILL